MHLRNNRADCYPGQAAPLMLKSGGKYHLNESGAGASDARICKLHVQDRIIIAERHRNCV